MFRSFNIEFSIRKGLGPDFFQKTISIGLDDLPADISEFEVKEMAKQEAERELYNSEDYPWYGKNWAVVNIYED